MRNDMAGGLASSKGGLGRLDPVTTPDTDNDTGKSKPGGSLDTTTYSADDISNLLYILEEEKLAGDVYELFYDVYGVSIFDNIAQSEDNHYAALLKQAENLDLDVDEIVLNPAGTFVDEDLQALYDSLIEAGSASLTAALEVGVFIEITDLEDLNDAAESVEGTTLEQVYESLLAGSENHLAAFEDMLIA